MPHLGRGVLFGPTSKLTSDGSFGLPMHRKNTHRRPEHSGFSWLLYDAATAVSFMEEQPDLETLLTNWVEGYREVRELPVEDVRMIPTFVQLRRIMIMGWIASHPKTDLARDTGGPYTEGSVRLAQAYLDGRFLTGLD